MKFMLADSPGAAEKIRRRRLPLAEKRCTADGDWMRAENGIELS